MATREEIDDLINQIQQSTVELFCNPDDLPGVEYFAGVKLIRSPLVKPGEIYIFNPEKGLS